MGELRLFEPINDVASFIYKNGRTYTNTVEASKILELTHNGFEATLSNVRRGKNVKNKWCYEVLLDTRIEYNGSFWYCKKTLMDFKHFIWEQEDFIYRILNALDRIIEEKLLDEYELCQLLSIPQKTMYQYRVMRTLPTFETALKIYSKLKETQYNDLRQMS